LRCGLANVFPGIILNIYHPPYPILLSTYDYRCELPPLASNTILIQKFPALLMYFCS
jgi:hypothetical protein